MKNGNKTLLLAILDPRSSIVKSVFDCRLSGVIFSHMSELINIHRLTVISFVNEITIYTGAGYTVIFVVLNHHFTKDCYFPIGPTCTQLSPINQFFYLPPPPPTRRSPLIASFFLDLIESCLYLRIKSKLFITFWPAWEGHRPIISAEVCCSSKICSARAQ